MNDFNFYSYEFFFYKKLFYLNINTQIKYIMTKKICFIHTETTGLHELINNKVYKKNLFGFARMVSITWMIAERTKNEEYKILKKEKYIVKPRCLIIPDDCVKFHGISQDIANKKGTEIETILDKFIVDIKNDVSIISSHGLEFHLKTIQAELVRYNKPVDFNKFILIDTNHFEHKVNPSTLINISREYLKKEYNDKSKTIDIICELFFKSYNDYELKIKK